MAKFIFTESQIEMAKKSMGEGRGSDFKTNRFEKGYDDRYRVECEVEIDSYGLNFNGKEIDYITAPKITMYFNIDIEARSWGIKDVMVYNPHGPNQIELEVIYYEDEDTQKDDVITIPLNWDDAQMEDADNMSYFGFDNLITIRLKNDEQGGLTSDFITTYRKTL
jgi:hypothetical protein